jgi:hypothetical protein
MSIRNRLVVGLLSFLASIFLAGAASAACVGSTCSLGGQLRAQIGNGLPLPISLNPAMDGDVRWGHAGQIKATPSATIQQQTPAPSGTPGTAPRSLRVIKPGVFSYDDALVSIGVVKANPRVFAVQTDIVIVNPHPGTTISGGTGTSGPFSTITLKAGGRTGPSVVSWCAGLPAPTASFNPGCAAPQNFGFFTTTTNGVFTDTPVTSGLVRYTATKNQFGAANGGRTLGTAMVFFNAGGIPRADLPCTTATNPLCLIAISTIVSGAGGRDVNGGVFGAKVKIPAFSTATGVYTGSVGANGTIKAVGVPITDGMGNFVPFTGQAATSWGFPGTTGKLTISVTQNASPSTPQTFTRTGGDHRTAGGSGIVVLVGGAVSARSISGPNGNRSWATYNVPEPSTIAAASAGFFALFGCHQLVRRRRR